MITYGLIGYGALGIQVESIIKEITTEQLSFVYFDDLAYQSRVSNAFPFNSFLDTQFNTIEFVVCIGYKHLSAKMEIIRDLQKKRRTIPSIIHTSSYISPGSRIEEGVIIYPMCNVDQQVKLGSGVLLNNSVTISHDSEIGSCSFLAPGVTVSGDVKVGDRTFMGTNAAIANSLTLGCDTIAGIGAVITKSFPDKAHLIGNPARHFTRRIKLK